MARRTLITGANRGLGLALAKLLIDGGDEVYATAREAQPDAVLALAPAGVVSLDLGDETSIVSAVAEVGHLTDGIDLLINCAGTDGRAYGMADDERHAFDFDAETFTDLMRINVTGPMVVIREALPLLRASADALILNFSSQLGSMQIAATKGRDAAYCVSKAALNMYTVKVAAELRDEGIAAVMLHPGWVQTDMGGPNAPITIAESSAAIVATIDGLSFADTGRFVNYDGTDMPW